MGTIARISIGFASRRVSFPRPALRGGSRTPSFESRAPCDGHRADGLQGNHYCSRDYGNGSNSYHYSNRSVSLSSAGSRTRLIRVRAVTAAIIMQTRMEASTTTTARERRRTRPLPTGERNEAARFLCGCHLPIASC